MYQFYRADSWRAAVATTKKNNPYIQKYISRLTTIGASARDRYLLTAYVFHLYLGLLAGGSMLKKMSQTKLRLRGSEGDAIFEKHGSATCRAIACLYV